MQINYASSSGIWKIFYQYTLAYRHFQIALSPSSSIKNLVDKKILEYKPSQQLITLANRIYHTTLCLLEGILPLIGLVMACVEAFFFNQAYLGNQVNPVAKAVIQKTPAFAGYGFEKDPETHVLDLSVRPANLFFNALGENAETTMPGSGELFKFLYPFLLNGAIFNERDNKVISFSAIDKKADLYKNGGSTCLGERSLEDYYGTGVYSLSYKEIKEIVKSQFIGISPLLPSEFYMRFKAALKLDQLDILPGSDSNAITLGQILSGNSLPYLKRYLERVEQNPSSYGFKQNGSTLTYEELKTLTLYQLGAMVLKVEDYHCFIDEGYKLSCRNVGDKDQIRLISASGIRGFHHTDKIPGNDRHQIDYKIMKNTFGMALKAVEKAGYFLCPAVGMGVWGGDPDVYWRAFLDAVVESHAALENIIVNPGHQKTKAGKYRTCGGEEFGSILSEYQKKYPQNENLKKIVNLFYYKTDLLLLAKNLKKQFPDKTIALVNASDPDVTLGNHVGEYVNNLCHPATTEENFTALGTNGLNFEKITQIQDDPERIIQADLNP